MAQTPLAGLMEANNFIALQKKLPDIITALMIIACTYQGAVITWQLLAPSEQLAPTASESSQEQVPLRRDDQKAFRELTSANLFGAVSRTPVETPREAPVTNLKLVLRGILSATPQSIATAIIAKSKNSEEEVYGVGDTISRNIKIKEIHSDHVILDSNGRLEILKLPKDSIGHESGSISTARPQDTKASLGNIRQKLLKEPTSFTEYAIPIAVKKQGKLIGYRLKLKEKGKILEEAGLKSSDVIVSLYGIKLDNPTQAMKAISKVSKARMVDMIIERDGQEMPLSINLQ